MGCCITGDLILSDDRRKALNTALHLTLKEYDRMIDSGAFEAINRCIELIRGELSASGPEKTLPKSADGRVTGE